MVTEIHKCVFSNSIFYIVGQNIELQNMAKQILVTSWISAGRNFKTYIIKVESIKTIKW